MKKVKAKAQAIQEAAKTAERAAYEQGLLETEQRLAEEVDEVDEVCRDYYSVT